MEPLPTLTTEENRMMSLLTRGVHGDTGAPVGLDIKEDYDEDEEE